MAEEDSDDATLTPEYRIILSLVAIEMAKKMYCDKLDLALQWQEITMAEYERQKMEILDCIDSRLEHFESNQLMYRGLVFLLYQAFAKSLLSGAEKYLPSVFIQKNFLLN